jgi:antitoxin component YwqK of YwqJK toxin-antitoxin module
MDKREAPVPPTDHAVHLVEIPYPTGAIRFRYAFVLSPDGQTRVRDGRFAEYHPNGIIMSEGIYVNGLEEGEWRDYYANGRLAAVGLYINGKEEGVWRFWDESGRSEPDVLYRSGVEQPAG